MWIQISILTYSLQEKEWLINMKSFTLTKYSIKFYFVSDRQRYRLNLRCHGCGSITANQAIYDQNANHKSQGLLKNVIVITINCCAWCLSCSSYNPFIYNPENTPCNNWHLYVLLSIFLPQKCFNGCKYKILSHNHPNNNLQNTHISKLW